MRKNIKNLDARPQAASSRAAMRVPIENANFSDICKFKQIHRKKYLRVVLKYPHALLPLP
jgi:hypothetical protein